LMVADWQNLVRVMHVKAIFLLVTWEMTIVT